VPAAPSGRQLVVVHAAMPGAKLRVIERKVLIQLGWGEEPEFAFGALDHIHLESIVTAALCIYLRRKVAGPPDQ
jgi:hypothetical protein